MAEAPWKRRLSDTLDSNAVPDPARRGLRGIRMLHSGRLKIDRGKSTACGPHSAF